MTDEQQQVPTVRSRMLGAGVSEERLNAHFERGAVELDGEVVKDLDQPAPHGGRIRFTGQ